MSKVNFEELEVITNCYKTDTHIFKIKAEILDMMRENKDFLLKIGTKIQRSMKQIAEKSNGKEWQESYEAIFEEITSQRIINHGLVPSTK
jgi:hypothetical protein